MFYKLKILNYIKYNWGFFLILKIKYDNINLNTKERKVEI